MNASIPEQRAAAAVVPSCAQQTRRPYSNCRLISCLLGVLAIHLIVPFATAQNLWHQYKQNPDQHENLPNASYAGYYNGERALPIPRASEVVVNVTAHGATGDPANTSDDWPAIKRAMDALPPEGGVLYFPDGTYHLYNVLFVHKSNVIVRGQSRAGTKLKFMKSLKDAYGANTYNADPSNPRSIWSWSGGLLWFTPKSMNDYRDPSTPVTGYRDSWQFGSMLASVTANASRGDRKIFVSTTTGIAPGDFVSIRQLNRADGTFSLMKHLCGDGNWAGTYNWTAANETGMQSGSPGSVNWIVQVAAVTNTTAEKSLTLKQPLRNDLRSGWEPRVYALGDTIRDSGVENLTILLNRQTTWTPSIHNQEPGWNGPAFCAAINCFLRGVTVFDSDNAFYLLSGKNITLTDFASDYSSTAKIAHHHFVGCSRSSADCLFEDFVCKSQPRHGISTEAFSSGIVWSRGKCDHGTFDTHRNIPYECLRTQIDIVNDGYGGGTGGPRMGARFVNWNIQLSVKPDLISANPIMPFGALVGLRGFTPPALDASSLCLGESGGIFPYPNNLYEAQRIWRTRQLDGLSPTADSYVRGGGEAAKNFGSGLELIVKDVTSDTSITRQSFLKYDLGGFPSTASAATLRLNVSGVGTEVTGTTPATINIYECADSWTESGLNWNNRPVTLGAFLGSVTVTGANQTVDIAGSNLLNYVKAQANGDRTASFALLGASNSNKYVAFSSRQHRGREPLLIPTFSSPQTIVYEFESLLPVGSSGEPFSINEESAASAGRVCYFGANGTGDHVTFAFDMHVKENQTYVFRLKRGPDRGKVEFSTSGSPSGPFTAHGGIHDLSTTGTIDFYDLPAITVAWGSTGTKYLRFRSAGPGVNGGYKIPFDRMNVTR